jgi:thymidine kinase
MNQDLMWPNRLRLLNCVMFIEPHFGRKKENDRVGWIEVICGCMFSGKTEELIRRLNRALIAKQRVEIFKPVLDKRYHQENIVSHNERAIRSTPVNFASDILLLAGNCDVVGVDEAQFFDEAIVDVCNSLANSGKRVIVAGLDMDFEGKPFGQMPNLLAVAEFVTKIHAICAQTGELASFSFRLSDNDKQVMLGEKAEYEARSRKAFLKGMKAKKHK